MDASSSVPLTIFEFEAIRRKKLASSSSCLRSTTTPHQDEYWTQFLSLLASSQNATSVLLKSLSVKCAADEAYAKSLTLATKQRCFEEEEEEDHRTTSKNDVAIVAVTKVKVNVSTSSSTQTLLSVYQALQETKAAKWSVSVTESQKVMDQLERLVDSFTLEATAIRMAGDAVVADVVRAEAAIDSAFTLWQQHARPSPPSHSSMISISTRSASVANTEEGLSQQYYNRRRSSTLPTTPTIPTIPTSTACDEGSTHVDVVVLERTNLNTRTSSPSSSPSSQWRWHFNYYVSVMSLKVSRQAYVVVMSQLLKRFKRLERSRVTSITQILTQLERLSKIMCFELSHLSSQFLSEDHTTSVSSISAFSHLPKNRIAERLINGTEPLLFDLLPSPLVGPTVCKLGTVSLGAIRDDNTLTNRAQPCLSVVTEETDPVTSITTRWWHGFVLSNPMATPTPGSDTATTASNDLAAIDLFHAFKISSASTTTSSTLHASSVPDRQELTSHRIMASLASSHATSLNLNCVKLAIRAPLVVELTETTQVFASAQDRPPHNQRSRLWTNWWSRVSTPPSTNTTSTSPATPTHATTTNSSTSKTSSTAMATNVQVRTVTLTCTSQTELLEWVHVLDPVQR